MTKVEGKIHDFVISEELRLRLLDFMYSYEDIFPHAENHLLADMLCDRKSVTKGWTASVDSMLKVYEVLGEMSEDPGSYKMSIDAYSIARLAAFPYTLKSFARHAKAEGEKQLDIYNDFEEGDIEEFSADLENEVARLSKALEVYVDDIHQLMLRDLKAKPLGRAILEREFVPEEVRESAKEFLQEHEGFLVGIISQLKELETKNSGTVFSFGEGMQEFLSGLVDIAEGRLLDKRRKALVGSTSIDDITRLVNELIDLKAREREMDPSELAEDSSVVKMIDGAEVVRKAYLGVIDDFKDVVKDTQGITCR